MPNSAFDNRKLSELVLHIVAKTEGIDYYHAFKILYFAEKKHLAKWGTGIMPDKFCALKYGPVPTHLYDAIKELGHPRSALARELAFAVQYAGEDAPNVLLPLREVDAGYLSESEVQSLDESIAENQNLTFGQLKRKSHDQAWEEAHQRQQGTNVISVLSMAKAENADPMMLEYIQQQILIDSSLR